MPDLQYEVIKRLLDEGYPITFLLAGDLSEELTSLKRKMLNDKYKENFVITGFLDEKKYYSAIACSDIITNLRCPTMGETSGTLLQSLVLGKPVIVSEYNQYNEYPNDVCWKLPDENAEIILYNYLKYLLSNKNIRDQLGKNAKEYSNLFTIDKIINLYTAVINL